MVNETKFKNNLCKKCPKLIIFRTVYPSTLYEAYLSSCIWYLVTKRSVVKMALEPFTKHHVLTFVTLFLYGCTNDVSIYHCLFVFKICFASLLFQVRPEKSKRCQEIQTARYQKTARHSWRREWWARKSTGR